MVEPHQTALSDLLINLFSNPEIAAGHLTPALRVISESCAKALNLDRVTIWRPTEIETEYQCLEEFDRARKTHAAGDILLINQYPGFFDAILNERFFSIRDIRGDSRTAGLEKDYLQAHHISSLLCVPLWIRGRLSGFLSFERKKADQEWSAEQEAFACQIADLVIQTIYAAQNRELKEQVEQYEKTLASVTAGTDAEIALHDLIRYATQLVDSDCGMVFITDARNRRCCCTVSYNAPDAYARAVLEYGEDAAGIVAETGQSLTLQNYQGWRQRSKQFKADGFSEVIAVPIHLRGKVAGVVQMMRQGVQREFVNWDQKMMEMLARQFAMIIDQSRQSERRLREENHLQAIQQMIDIASQATDLSVTFDRSMNLVLECVALEKGSIHTPILITGRGISSEEEMQIYQALDRNGSGFSTPVCVDNWSEYSGSLSDLAAMMKGNGIQASMFVPIQVETKFLGCIGVHSTSPRAWTEHGVRQVQVVARIISVTVDRLTTHQYLEIHTRLMNKLNNINRAFNRIFTFDESIKMIGQAAIDLLEADRAILFLRNPDGSIDSPWSEGFSTAQIERSLKSESEELAQISFGSATPVTIPAVKPSHLPAQFKKMLTSEGVQCLITLPLIYNGQVVGTIACCFRKERKLTALERSVIEAFTSQGATAMQNAWMHEQMEQGYTDVALALARAMDARDSSISDSSLQVAQWAEETGRRLGLSDKEIKDLHWAALLHNIGKVSVPDQVLNKPGALNETEWRVIRQSPVQAEAMIQPLARFHDVGQIIRHSRERFDGSGYPDQCKGDEIPLAARVLCVADAFTSMLDNRSYRKAMNPQEAMQELEQGSGKQFDPQVVSAFVDTVKTERSGNGRRGPHHN